MPIDDDDVVVQKVKSELKKPVTGVRVWHLIAAFVVGVVVGAIFL